MSRSSSPFPWSGAALAGGGAALAAFILLHPPGGLGRPETMAGARWILSHTFHFIGALLVLLGLPGARLHLRGGAGGAGAGAAWLAAAVGTAMFAGTGMLTAWVWPALAAHDPALAAPDGPLLSGIGGRGPILATYAFLIVGWVALAAVGLGRRRRPGAGWAALGAGALLLGVPVAPLGPAPWAVRVTAFLLVGLGFVLIGAAIHRGEGGAGHQPVPRHGAKAFATPRKAGSSSG